MQALRRFLAKYRVARGQPHNMVSMKKPEGGCFNIPPEQREKFYQLYENAIPLFTETDYECLVYRPPPTDMQPFYCDVDLRFLEAVDTVDTKRYCKLGSRIAEFMAKEYQYETVEFLVVKKNKGYWKTINGVENWCMGAHLYFGELLFSLETSLEIRSASIPFCDEAFDGLKLANSFDDCLDIRICKRSNGLVLPGCRKYGSPQTGAYLARAMCRFQDGETNINELTTEQFYDNFKLKQLVDFVFCEARKAPEQAIPKVQKAPQPPRATDIIGAKTALLEGGFNLKAFLAATEGWTPGGGDYVDLVMWMCKCGVDSLTAETLCNSAWDPPANQRSETRKMIDKYSEKPITVTKGAPMGILQRHATNEWKEDDIFPRQKYKYYNQYVAFCNRNIHRDEFCKFLKDVVSYSFTDKKFIWKVHYDTKDKRGNVYREEMLQLSKFPPFHGSDDFKLKVFPSLEELEKVLQKSVPKKIDPKRDADNMLRYQQITKLVGRIHTLTIKQAYELAKKLLPSDPIQRIAASKLITLCHEDHELKRYVKTVFRPFCGLTDPTSTQVYNTFRPFHLLTYTPSRQIDIKKTHLWSYFRDVWGHGDEKSEVLAEFWKRIAFLLQFPQIRSHRIVCLRSEAQGTGKSKMFLIISKIIGTALCRFHSSMGTLINPFNWTNHSMKLHFVDDLTSSGRLETRKIFPLITTDMVVYTKKGETSITFDEFSEIWLTSNDDSPLHTSRFDRRIVMYEASELWLQDRVKFQLLTLELEDLDICHGWFKYFQQLDITGWSPQDNPPNDLKDKSVENCMPRSHLFVSSFFSEDNWFTLYKQPHVYLQGWMALYELGQAKGKAKGKMRIRVEQGRVHDLYKEFMRRRFPSSKPRQITTFLKEIQAIMVTVPEKRQKIKKINKRVVDIIPYFVQARIRELYPTLKSVDWECINNPKEFQEAFSQAEGVQMGFLPETDTS